MLSMVSHEKSQFRYEMSNCLFEATLQEIEFVCGCTPKNFVDIVDGFDACGGQKKRCMNELMQVQCNKQIILLV